MNQRRRLNVAGIVLRSALVASICSSAWAEPPDFAREVRPILEKSCFGCHGPERQRSGYRLDVREIAIGGGDFGEPAIVPHDANGSPLIRYVSGEDEQMRMPPDDSELPRLGPEEVATLRAWIDAGPAWPEEYAGSVESDEPRWSLEPLVKPELPAPDRHPIDAFVRAKLAARGLAAAPRADRRTLARRTYYDLVGLPPTPEEMDAFLANEAPGALAELIDRLLASPRYGEHWARHWLDVVHYADTHGNDHDYARPNAWPYRDYVIRSLNEDKPYARFVEQQVAGDVLFPEDPQATVALGFLAAGPWDDTLMVTVGADTVDHRMSQVLDRDNMVSTVMSTFQSTTVHCARCHDHKFDPISQRDYYRLQAVFAGVDRADRPFDVDETTHIRRRRLREQKHAIEQRDARLLASLNAAQMLQKIDAAAEAQLQRAEGWKLLEIVSVASASGVDGTSFSRLEDGSWLVSGERPEKDTFIITATTKVTGIVAIRLETLADERLPGGGPGRYDSGNFHLTQFRASAMPATGETGASRLEFVRALATHGDHEGRNDVVENAIDGRDDTMWSIHPRYGEAHEAVFELKEPVGHDEGTTWIVRLEQNGTTGHQIGRFRLTVCTEELPAELRAPQTAAAKDLLRIPAAERTAAQQQELFLRLRADEVNQELAALPEPGRVYAVTRDFPAMGSFTPAPEPRPIHVLLRGDIDKPGELVGPGALQCLPELPGDFDVEEHGDESQRRAALARWLADERNVLTWRSIVNRVWHYHFGRGLCDTPNDFGKMGGVPSHPELLDWLAVWFRDEAKGSLKALHRLIMTSETWQQSAKVDFAGGEPAVQVDGENRLLWRANRRRLTAEQFRDSVLQLSGRIDLTVGGPPAVQFVERGDATFMTGGAPAFLDYDSFDPDHPAGRRRAVYRFLFRTVPDPLMDALDAPDGGAMTPVRSVSTTPLQAFALLNNAFVIRQCEHMATRLAEAETGADGQLEAAFKLILLRAASAEEKARLRGYLERHGLANVCHILINSNEFFQID